MPSSGLRARFGEMSRNRVLKTWYTPSRSTPNNPPYETQLHDDGILTCNCRGWINHPERICTHVRSYLGEAQRFLDGRSEDGRSEEGIGSHVHRAASTGRWKPTKEEEKTTTTNPFSKGRGRKITIGSGWTE